MVLKLFNLLCLWSIVFLGVVPTWATAASVPKLPLETSRTGTVARKNNPLEISRDKRYVGWGRRPGLGYHKAVSDWYTDFLFNKMNNNFYDKRSDNADSHFRELRMRQNNDPSVSPIVPSRVYLKDQDNEISLFPPGDTENSHFRELRMRQIPQIQLMIPHLFGRNGRSVSNSVDDSGAKDPPGYFYYSKEPLSEIVPGRMDPEKDPGNDIPQ